MLYGGDARVGEPYIGYDNPFGRTVDMNYAWTQVNERILDQASSMIGGRLRFFVEVGSFMGKSSVLIADWLRRQETHVVPSGRGHASLLCIDTWTGDLGMTLGHICACGTALFGRDIQADQMTSRAHRFSSWQTRIN